jgi:phosphoenolpyruvate synthase/pyruvate phosphate dikinase
MIMVDILSREERLITRISAVRRDDVELAEGKGANLGELTQGGFPVPDGFIVSIDAYATVVADAGLAAVIAEGLATGSRRCGRPRRDRLARRDRGAGVRHPGVIATGSGTSVLAEGQRITVEGDTGLVTAA